MKRSTISQPQMAAESAPITIRSDRLAATVDVEKATYTNTIGDALLTRPLD